MILLLSNNFCLGLLEAREGVGLGLYFEPVLIIMHLFLFEIGDESLLFILVASLMQLDCKGICNGN
jgi:hypothetical protein